MKHSLLKQRPTSLLLILLHGLVPCPLGAITTKDAGAFPNRILAAILMSSGLYFPPGMPLKVLLFHTAAGNHSPNL